MSTSLLDEILYLLTSDKEWENISIIKAYDGNLLPDTV